jgi:hypothetical protein
VLVPTMHGGASGNFEDGELQAIGWTTATASSRSSP